MFRLYYNDNCVHEDNTERLNDPKQSDPQHQVDYLGVLHQVLLDLADWCEKTKLLYHQPIIGTVTAKLKFRIVQMKEEDCSLLSNVSPTDRNTYM